MELKSDKKERLFLSLERRIVLRKKIDDFAKLHGVPEFMADLFIDEVRLSDDDLNDELKVKATLMGLM